MFLFIRRRLNNHVTVARLVLCDRVWLNSSIENFSGPFALFQGIFVLDCRLKAIAALESLSVSFSSLLLSYHIRELTIQGSWLILYNKTQDRIMMMMTNSHDKHTTRQSLNECQRRHPNNNTTTDEKRHNAESCPLVCDFGLSQTIICLCPSACVRIRKCAPAWFQTEFTLFVCCLLGVASYHCERPKRKLTDKSTAHLKCAFKLCENNHSRMSMQMHHKVFLGQQKQAIQKC